MATSNKKRSLSIWSFVGFIFIIYGLVISGTGVYYLFKPQTEIALYHLDSSLWWGLFLLVVGLIFNWADLRAGRKERDA